MPQEKSPIPVEQQPVENSEPGRNFQLEIEEFKVGLEKLGVGDDAEVLIELAKQFIKRFSELKTETDFEDGLDLYISLDYFLNQVAKRDDLTSLFKVRLEAQMRSLRNSNPSFSELVLAASQEEAKSNQALETPDKEEAPPALSEKQKLESYIDDLRLESSALNTLVARIKLQLGQTGFNLSNSSYSELLKQEKLVGDLKNKAKIKKGLLR